MKQTVRVQPGGRVEVISPDLPDGGLAEVIVLLPAQPDASGECLGLFADTPDLMDRVVADAMANRELAG